MKGWLDLARAAGAGLVSGAGSGRLRGRRCRRHRGRRLAQLAGEAGQQALEALLLQPGQQHVGIGLLLVEGLGLGRRGHVVPERDQLARDARQLGIVRSALRAAWAA